MFKASVLHLLLTECRHYMLPLKGPCHCLTPTAHQHIRDGRGRLSGLPGRGPGQGSPPLPCSNFTFAMRCSSCPRFRQVYMEFFLARQHARTLHVLACSKDGDVNASKSTAWEVSAHPCHLPPASGCCSPGALFSHCLDREKLLSLASQRPLLECLTVGEGPIHL